MCNKVGTVMKIKQLYFKAMVNENFLIEIQNLKVPLFLGEGKALCSKMN